MLGINAQTGQPLAGIDHLRQSIRDILTTRIGTRVMCRDYGSRLPTLIDNPISTAPGFTLGNVHVMAGVPNIFEAMLAGVLPTLTGGAPLLSQSLRVNRGEGEIAAEFGALAAEFPDLSMGSYPFNTNGVYGTNLVIRGTDAGRIDAAMTRLVALFG